MKRTKVYKKRPIEERFWEKVDKHKPDECWEWLAHKSEKGYGHFRKNGKMYRAHRFAYEILVGVIPEGLQIDHLCKNRSCVNPAHLRVVTSAENTQAGLVAKLTKADIPKIKKMYSRGHTQKEVARLFGVGQRNISNIINGKTWIDV